MPSRIVAVMPCFPLRKEGCSFLRGNGRGVGLCERGQVRERDWEE